MRRLLPFLAVLAVGLAMLLAGAAHATSATTTDPSGDAGSGATIDLVSVSHNDSGSPVKVDLTINTVGNFTADDVSFVLWRLDFNGDNTPDACVTEVSENANPATKVIVQLEDYKTTTNPPDCDGFPISGTTVVTTTFSTPAKTFTVSVSKADLVTAGMSATAASYRYQVESADFAGGSDFVPNVPTSGNQPFITHTFGAAAATPTVTPTFIVETQSVATVTPANAARGAQVTVTGSGCRAGAPASVLFDTTSVATAIANAAGSVSAVFKVPTAANPGVHRISIVCTGPTGSFNRAIASFTVIAGGLPPGGDAPFTPLRVGIALLSGAFLAGAGIAVTRRRVLARR